jgi:sugar/nucleoside kinase (ribokinase family)
VLIVGSMALDTIETPFGRRDDAVGGAGTYAGLAASLVAPVRLVGVVGDDFPRDAMDDLAARGVDLAGVETVPGGKSFRWGGVYHFDMNTRDTLFTELNVFADFNPRIPDAWRQTPYVFLANIQPQLQLSVLDQVSGPRFVVADTMNFWIEGEREALDALLARIDMLVINDAELRLLSGEHNLALGAEKVLAMGPRWLVVKKGEYGAALVSAEGHFALPALPLPDVVDPTGAGDSFAGGLIGMLAWLDDTGGEALRQALAAGTAVASLCVQDFGVEALKRLTVRELHDRYETLRAMTLFPSCALLES